jgi:hypothetical protein
VKDGTISDDVRGPSWAAARKPLGIFLVSVAFVTFSTPTGSFGRPLTLLLLGGALFVFLSQPIRWESLLVVLIGVIFLIPIKRYTLPGSLPFNLEPYRLFVAAIVTAWLVALLVDPRVRLRRSGLETPILGFALVALFSLVVNPGRLRISGITVEAVKSLTFFLSFVLVFYLVVSVVRSTDTVDSLLKIVVGSGALVAALAVIENRTNYNLFDHLGFLPGLTFHDPRLDAAAFDRGGRLRAYASAQHPIALAAVLVMLIPVGLYLARRYRQKRWWAATALIALGAAATVSRTGVVMLLVALLVLLILRPRQTARILRFVPLLVLLVAMFSPNSIRGLYDAFAPKGGLIKEQSQLVANNPNAQARLADVVPSLRKFSHHPFLGICFGTRVLPSYTILDDQWLGSLLETGIVGVFLLALLFFRSLRRLGSVAMRDTSPRGELCAALAASSAAFGVGMLTFDTFAFIQVTYVFFLLLGLGAVVLHPDTDGVAAGAPATLLQPSHQVS